MQLTPVFQRAFERNRGNTAKGHNVSAIVQIAAREYGSENYQDS